MYVAIRTFKNYENIVLQTFGAILYVQQLSFVNFLCSQGYTTILSGIKE